MKEKTVKDWGEFEQFVEHIEQLRIERAKKLAEEVSETLAKVRGELHLGTPPVLLYRGQSNASWELKTTLERYTNTDFSLLAYYTRAYVARTKIESLSGVEWPLPKPKDYKEWLKKELSVFAPLFNKTYSYMAHLRHSGFPSPLLDWTASPYIAAFFAMASVEQEVESVAVFVYLEGIVKTVSFSRPTVHALGPNVRTHKRHHLQQSRYTICVVTGKDEGLGMENARYAPHKDIATPKDESKERFWKIVIPASQRVEFLKRLVRMNINAFSLFADEDSLIRTVAVEQLLLK